MKIRLTADAIYIANRVQDLYAIDREVFALRFLTEEGKHIIVELPGQGARYLRKKIFEAFATHPEMEEWGSSFGLN